MQVLDSVATANDYSDAATISNVFQSNGGYFVVGTNDVFMELEYGGLGQTWWTNEVHVPVGNGILQPGTTGIKFRNYTANAGAVVSAGLAENAEPSIVLTSGGLATPASSGMITGQVSSAGAILGGTGFTVVRTGAGRYTVSFNFPYPSPPTVEVTAGASSFGSLITSVPPTTTSFTVAFNNLSNVATDNGFSFTSQQTV